MFLSTQVALSAKYSTDITPDGWAFSIWGLIYAWQGAHVIYSLTLLCRKNSEGGYLYTSPGHLHFSFYIAFMLNNVCNLAWIFSFDREELELALVSLALEAFTLYVCGVIICKYLDKAGSALETLGAKKEIWLARIFTLNGIALYGTWTTIATLLNFCIVLQYKGSVSVEVSAWVALVILTLELIVWFVLETFVFDRYLRYCFTPYLILIVALPGILTKNYTSTSQSHLIYTMVLLGISIVLGVFKLVVMFVKGHKRPIEYRV